jgi:hypothetical protein
VLRAYLTTVLVRTPALVMLRKLLLPLAGEGTVQNTRRWLSLRAGPKAT